MDSGRLRLRVGPTLVLAPAGAAALLIMVTVFLPPFGQPSTPSASPSALPVASLEGPQWVLGEYVDASKATRPVQSSTMIVATFRDGSLSGGTGCNHLLGRYERSGDTIHISDLAPTIKGCINLTDPSDRAIMEQEAAYLAALRESALIHVIPGRLELSDRSGVVLLSYVAR
jgi:heat shock protein HslJ